MIRVPLKSPSSHLGCISSYHDRGRHLGRIKAKEKHKNYGQQHRSNLDAFHQKVYESNSSLDKMMAMPWPQSEGAFLTPATKLLRLSTLTAILQHGRPLAVLDELRSHIEGDGSRGTLTHSNHMGNLLPLFETELDRVLSEMKFYSLSIIFDGLSDKGNWVSVLFRGVLVGESMHLVQGLLDMPHTSRPYDHAVLNKILIKATSKLQRCGGLRSQGEDLVRFLIHDDAEVNNKTCRFLQESLFTLSMSISCLCHVEDRVGGRAEIPLLEKFQDIWYSLFKNADKRRTIFRHLTNLPFPSLNRIKWHSVYELLTYFQSNLDAIATFVSSPQLRSEIAESKSKRLPVKVAEMRVLLLGDLDAAQTIAKSRAEKGRIEDKNQIADLVAQERAAAPARSNSFKIQLAAAVDGSRTLIYSTYALEGDGATVFFAWELWHMSSRSVHLFATDPLAAEQDASLGLLLSNIAVWRDHLPDVRAIFTPAYEYMEEQMEKHCDTLKFLKIINGLCPWNAKQFTRASIDYLVETSFLLEKDVGPIEFIELPLFQYHGPRWLGCGRPSPAEYLQRQSPKELLPEARVWRFWYQFQRMLPKMAVLVKTLAAAQAHSAAAERTGSLFTHDKTAQAAQSSVSLVVVRQRMHYSEVVDPMQNMPLAGLAILDNLPAIPD